MYYNRNGKKERSENFLVGGFSENYGTMKGDKKWMYWLLAALVVITIILVVLWFVKKNKKGNGAIGYKFW